MPTSFTLDGLDGLIRATGLHVVRILATLWMLPVFGPSGGARLLKIGLGLVLGVLVAWIRLPQGLEDPGSEPLHYSLLVLKEVLFGLLLGWSAGLIFEAARLAGGLIATEMGLNLANQVDPVTRASQPLVSHLLQSVAFILFFLAGGHRLVLAALVRSFEAVPPGSFQVNDRLAGALLEFTALVMSAGLRLAGPVFLLMILVSLGVGLLAKVAPGLHILEASYPIRILAALLFMVIFMPGMLAAFDRLMDVVGQNFLQLAEGRL